SSFLKRSVVFVVKKQTGCRIAADKEVRPSVVIIVASEYSKSVVLTRRLHTGLLRHIDKMLVSIIVVKRHRFTLKAARSTGNRHAFPVAAAIGTPRWRLLSFEVDVVGHYQIEVAIAIVIEEGTSCAPP